MHISTHATTRTQRHTSSCRLAGAFTSPSATPQCSFPSYIFSFLLHIPFYNHHHDYHSFHFSCSCHYRILLSSPPLSPFRTALLWRAKSAATFCGSRVRACPWPSSRFLATARFHEPWASTRFLFLSTHHHVPRLSPHWGSVAQQCWLFHSIAAAAMALT